MATYVVLWILAAVVIAAGFLLETGILTFLGVAVAAVGFGIFVAKGQRTH